MKLGLKFNKNEINEFLQIIEKLFKKCFKELINIIHFFILGLMYKVVYI